MDLLEVAGRMAELFPPGHPDSPWLIRLMIIRDDVEFEFRSLWLNPDATTDDCWRCTYFFDA